MRNTISKLFYDQTLKNPNALALTFSSQRWSFLELDIFSNKIAHFLRAKRPQKAAKIAFTMQPSAEAIGIILGIFKANCIYIPLDPQRAQTIIDELKPDFVFSDQNFTQYKSEIVAMPSSQIAIDSDVNAPQYFIYTSGSTGIPKAIMGHQTGLLNRFEWMWEEWPFSANEQCCQKTPFYFIDSIWEIFGPLLKGISLHIVPIKTYRNVEQFLDFLEEHAITRIVLVPSYLQALLENLAKKKLSRLAIWIVSGEVLPVNTALLFQHKFPKAKLLNLYGSSEVAADVTYFEVHSWNRASTTVPIGKPIRKMMIHLLDENANPMPLGEVGEICVQGPGVALGYFGLSDATHKAFTKFNGQKIYRTGDFGRYLADGNLEYLGRRDRQIKINGIRIELDEIEHRLKLHPKVDDCLITINDRFRLIAYVITKVNTHADKNELYVHLKNSLPSSMLPTQFIFLKKWPLTSVGKKNLQQLADIKNPENIFSDFEVKVAKIWSEIILFPVIDRNDNFFQLGGDSFDATTLSLRLEAELGKTISAHLIFEYPVFNSFVKALEQHISVQKYARNQNMVTEASCMQTRFWQGIMVPKN